MRYFETPENYLANGDRLTIGQMAELCCTSRRALRFYDEKGLVKPAQLDEDTGYRFYSINQVPLIDRIFRLQNQGFSLQEIKQILAGLDKAELVQLYERRRREAQREIERLSIAKDQLEDFLVDKCLEVQTGWMDAPILEWRPEQKIVAFDIANLGITIKRAHSKEGVDLWYYAMMEFKRELQSRGFPDVAFNEVSTIVLKEDLERGVFRVARACLLLGSVIPEGFIDYEVIEAGYYLSYYTDNFYSPDGTNSEWRGVCALLEYAKKNGYELRGNYMGIGNVDKPIHECDMRHDRLLFTIPVQLVAPAKD